MSILSPDCRDSNHRKCNGDAWDEERDQIAPCSCTDCPCGDRLPPDPNHPPLVADEEDQEYGYADEDDEEAG